ncbi:MAG: tRNA pseudouridine(38-40) synthase TruA [Crocinitomicaceae bacterium]|nr:tRNA pseudouridine(38-40) synthase TruA [Crocinitomicaceae bacterium]
MQRYFFCIAYDGTDFFGWQRQEDVLTVQEAIEQAISKLFGQKHFPITGCGRTDTGVHASYFIFHADLPSNQYAEDQLKYKLNLILPKSIAIYSIQKVSPGLHARFDAKSRTYHYFIHTKKDPFLNGYSLYHPQQLDVAAMQEASLLLLGRQDFTSFSKLHTDVKHNYCEVYNAEWKQIAHHRLQFEISANRFLRNMVRATVGTLLLVGEKKMDPKDVKQILANKNRGTAGKSVAAHGLFLANVTYDGV